MLHAKHASIMLEFGGLPIEIGLGSAEQGGKTGLAGLSTIIPKFADYK